MKYLRILVLFSMAMSPHMIKANEINFSGFATMAGGLTFDDDENLYDYDDIFSLSSNSHFGLQASTSINDQWGATAQIISRGNDAWDTKFSWAYISYDATDEWRLLFGRQRVPFYMYSDFIDVSYAYHWITGPEAVYSIGFDDFDGVGSIYTSTIGDFDSTFHVAFGRNTDALNIAGEEREGSDIANLFSTALTLNDDWLTLRLGYSRADVTIPVADFQPLLDNWIAAGFPAVADGIELNDDEWVFIDFAFIIDYENFLIVGEITDLDEDDTTVLNPSKSYYLSLGYRVNDVLWHFTHSATEGSAGTGVLSEVPVGVDPGLDFLTALTAATFASNDLDVEANTIGLRWEFAEAMALKAEFTKYSDNITSASDASLIRVALTTVF